MMNYMNTPLPLEPEYLEVDLYIDHLFEDQIQEINYITWCKIAFMFKVIAPLVWRGAFFLSKKYQIRIRLG